MIISHKYRFIFVKTYKTAGTSIEVFLSQACGPRDVLTPIRPPVPPHLPQNHRGLFNPYREIAAAGGRGKKVALRDFRRRRKYYHHLPAYIIRSRTSKKIWNSYFKFCVERNPWDKTLSHYHMLKDRMDEPLSLESYLSNQDFALNCPLYTESGQFDKVIVDRVVRYERLSEELSDIFSQLGISFNHGLGVHAKAESRTDRRPYAEVFSDYQREAVAEAFAAELALHHYDF